MRHAGQVITRTMLLEQVWDFQFDPKTSVIDTQVSRLRAKIDKDFEHPLLHTTHRSWDRNVRAGITTGAPGFAKQSAFT